MRQELDYKGNFYEKVKRNSMMIRESLEQKRASEMKLDEYSP